MSVICTLYEGNYHFGLGALTNSLYAQGFRGEIYAGYRGTLPPWAAPNARKNGVGSLFDVSDGCTLHLLPVTTERHFNNFKPHFMLEVMERHCPTEERFFFFDPDIVVKAPWNFFEDWLSHGIALCEDVNHYLPRTHPVRLAWKKYAAQHRLPIRQELDKFYNGGFFGVRRDHQDFLRAWKELFERRAAEGVDLGNFELSGFEFPYLYLDQDLMNLALMLTPYQISAVGPEGMDFQPGGKSCRIRRGPEVVAKAFCLGSAERLRAVAHGQGVHSPHAISHQNLFAFAARRPPTSACLSRLGHREILPAQVI
jgi:hypothetical protein